MRKENFVVLNVPSAAGADSDPVYSGNAVNWSVQATVTDATAEGTVTIQVSNDNLTPTNWETLDDIAIAAGEGGFLNFSNMSVQWMRISLAITTPGDGDVVVTVTQQNA